MSRTIYDLKDRVSDHEKGNKDIVTSLFDDSEFNTETYKRLFGVAYDEYKNIQEGNGLYVSVDSDKLSEILDTDSDVTDEMVDEVYMLIGYLAGLHKSINIISDQSDEIVRENIAYMDNKNYSVLKKTFDRLVDTFFSPIKRIQYTRGKIDSKNFFELIQYGALIDLKELFYKVRFNDLKRIQNALSEMKGNQKFKPKKHVSSNKGNEHGSY